MILSRISSLSASILPTSLKVIFGRSISRSTTAGSVSPQAARTLPSGAVTFHGFGLAQTMREQRGARSLTAHGTLYKALGRLEELGLLTSRWEDADAVEGRPRRRLYELTGLGARVAEQARADRAGRASGSSPRVGLEPV